MKVVHILFVLLFVVIFCEIVVGDNVVDIVQFMCSFTRAVPGTSFRKFNVYVPKKTVSILLFPSLLCE